MSGEQALVHLAQSTAEAVAGVLRALGVEDVTTGPTTVAASAAQALQALPTPGVAANVAYVDGVTGGNVFGLSTAGARLLAAATMGGGEPQPDAELSEVELAAVSEAITKMMAAAAAATSAVLATAIEIGVPEIRTIALQAEAAEAFDDPGRAGHRHSADPRRRAVPARAARPDRVRRSHDDGARRPRR
jgi:flagellar motor switch protein FliN/FliY